MKIDIISIFPHYLAPVHESLLGKALQRGLIDLQVHDLRNWTDDPHHSVDDAPYGGGPGMVMKAPVWGAALDQICHSTTILIVPTPSGKLFTQDLAQQWSTHSHLVFACGRYEGIDQRVIDDASRRMRVEEVSIGDYVLAGGEAPTLVMIEAITRLIPGVLGNPQSIDDDSHCLQRNRLLEGPQYTRPAHWRGLEVPAVLLSGNHAHIATWRHQRAIERTRQYRPELLID